MEVIGQKILIVGLNFRKVTDFEDCVTVYGADLFKETNRGPFTKFQFNINTEEALIDFIETLLTKKHPLDDETIMQVARFSPRKFFFELYVACKEAIKWGCAENYIVHK